MHVNKAAVASIVEMAEQEIFKTVMYLHKYASLPRGRAHQKKLPINYWRLQNS